MSNTKHTPTPWTVGGSVIEHKDETIAQAFRMLGCPIDQPAVNAAFIVRACNSHEQMVGALRGLIDATDDYSTMHAPDGDDAARMVAYAAAFDKARAVLASVEA